jgi:hypothetical protein
MLGRVFMTSIKPKRTPSYENPNSSASTNVTAFFRHKKKSRLLGGPSVFIYHRVRRSGCHGDAEIDRAGPRYRFKRSEVTQSRAQVKINSPAKAPSMA